MVCVLWCLFITMLVTFSALTLGGDSLTLSPTQDLFQAYTSDSQNKDNLVFHLAEGTYYFSEQLLVANGKQLTISGASKELTILDCRHKMRAFEVNKGALTLLDLTIQNCNNTMVSLSLPLALCLHMFFLNGCNSMIGWSHFRTRRNTRRHFHRSSKQRSSWFAV